MCLCVNHFPDSCEKRYWLKTRRSTPPIATAEESNLVKANRVVTFARRNLARSAMAQSPPPPFDPYRPPVIEGFTPTFRGSAEPFQSKFVRKFRENPFVPLGCLGTAGILTYGLICFINNKPKQSQMMMRARVIAQGLTVASLLVGMAVTNLKTSK